MNNKTIVTSDIQGLVITINGQRIPTHLTPKGVVSQLLNSQVRELGHEPFHGSQYILVEGCELRLLSGGALAALLDLPRMTKYGEGVEIISSYLTPVLAAKALKIRKPRPRRDRDGPPARRGPAAKFVPLFAACKELIEAHPGNSVFDNLIAGLAIAKRVAGED